MELPKSLPDSASQLKISSWLNHPEALNFRRILESRLLEHKLAIAAAAMTGASVSPSSRVGSEAIMMEGTIKILSAAAEGLNPFENGDPFDFSTFKTS